MGRRKISIQPITDERNRKVTFVKRKAGLFKKAHELAVLCQVDLAVIILGNNNSKFYEYSSVNVQDLLGDFKDSKFLHDSKTPADYGDYELKSRVRGRGELSSSRASSNTHNRNTSMNSVSMDDNLQSSDDEEGEEDDDEEEEDIKPPPKRRKVKEVKEKSQNQQKISKQQQQQQQQQRAQAQYQQQQQAQSHPGQPQNLLPPPNISAVPVQYQQVPPHQHQYEHHQMVPPSYMPQEGIPNHQQTQAHHPPQGSFHPNHAPPQYQFPVPQYQLPPQQSPYLAQQQIHQQQQHSQQQPPPPQRQPSEPVSSNASTPVIPSSKPVMNPNSPFTNSQRARSMNSSISSRPQLRVEIPKDHKNSVGANNNNNNKNGPGDSAMTVTAIDTGKNNSNIKENTDGNNTPTSGSSKPDDNRPGLGILSNKSTPISATLPSGLFSLPPPQPNPQYQNNNFKPPLNINTGEQTPLTGGLPSRYVPDLFPSPSNFYSNEWNIPFGSGNTPYPNSAIQPGQMLPNINNGKFAKHSNLQNDGTGAGGGVNSPLQNTPLGNQTRKKEDEKSLQGKRIKFEEPE